MMVGVDLELLTFLGVLLSLIVSIIGVWEKLKPKYPVFQVYMSDKNNLLIENKGTKKGVILELKINNEPLNKFSIQNRTLPIQLEVHNKIQIPIIRNDSVPTPEICSLKYKYFYIFTKTKIHSL
jgi:hypothetical protein